MLSSIVKDNRYFYYPYLVLLVGCVITLFYIEKGDLTIYVNSHHSAFGDVFFKWYTYVGTLWVGVPVIIVLLVQKRNWGYLFALSYAISGGITQLLKRQLIDDNFRPFYALMRSGYEFHQVEGVVVKKSFSFPSGHTCTGFLLFLTLTLLVENKKWGVLFLVGAVFVAISRMYLYQHFFQDTVMGSFIGVFTITSLYYIFKKKALLS